MIRTALTAALFSLSAACGGQAQDESLPSDAGLPVSAEHVVLFPDDPGRMRVGDLRYMGGVELSSEDERFGGWSALHLNGGSDALALIMLSDRGGLAQGRLALDNQSAPSSIQLDQFERLTDPDGAPLDGAAADAEGLAVLSEDVLAISFERDHRVWSYPRMSPLIATPLALPPRTQGMGNNAGLEGLAVDDSHLWASVEYPIRGEEAHTLWRYDRADMDAAPTEFQLALDPDYGITALESDSVGGLYLLQRFYRRGVGNRIRVLHLTADQIATSGEAALEPALLAELTEDMTVDNIEGLAVVEINGETRLFLISDDNFNESQRTLLLSFAIEPRD
ncbi:esterase-like activity of phytase family protein [Oceanicaulis sp.]|uniref:esterase-like activity of phytase family protein n=1 Tax=Oceanicaulis sp. TaxID=1924941 RepID=UPI003BA8D9E9